MTIYSRSEELVSRCVECDLAEPESLSSLGGSAPGVVDGILSIRHNASATLAMMPAWYYFSCPSNLAFHDFTKKHKPEKNLRSLLGLGLKFIPTPSLTNSWSRLRKSSYDRLFRSVHLRFHFAGKPPSEGTTSYDPKLYVRSKWTPPHWTIPPSHLRNVYHVSPWLSTNCSKHVKAKQTFYCTSNEHYKCCNNNRHS